MSTYIRFAEKIPPYQDIPVVINNFNRLDCLIKLLNWLNNAGMRNIVIIDNGSTFPPLLEYYKTIGCEVVRGENLGPLAIWKTKQLWRRIRGNYFVYTDVDVVPDEGCPLDAIDFLLRFLIAHPNIEKIGFGLRIDDLPDCYEKKSDVIAWEKQYWLDRYGGEFFNARVDTTFALYRPFAAGGWWLNSVRTDYPYVAGHLPWYQNSKLPSDEDVYYVKNSLTGVSSWSEANGFFGNKNAD